MASESGGTSRFSALAPTSLVRDSECLIPVTLHSWEESIRAKLFGVWALDSLSWLTEYASLFPQETWSSSPCWHDDRVQADQRQPQPDWKPELQTGWQVRTFLPQEWRSWPGLCLLPFTTAFPCSLTPLPWTKEVFFSESLWWAGLLSVISMHCTQLRTRNQSGQGKVWLAPSVWRGWSQGHSRQCPQSHIPAQGLFFFTTGMHRYCKYQWALNLGSCICLHSVFTHLISAGLFSPQVFSSDTLSHILQRSWQSLSFSQL